MDVLYQVSDGVALLTLNRPDRLNAIDTAMIELLLSHLEQAAADRQVRVVLLTGAGRGFCAGGDLKAMAARPAEPDAGPPDPAAQVRMMRGLTRAVELLREIPKPTVAAVNGPCAGAGLSLACGADLRYAAASALFTTAFVTAGQSGDYGGSWTLPRLVGAGRARELYLTGRRFAAEEAERMGLVSAVFPDAEFPEAVRGVTAGLAASAPLTLAAIKANLNDSEGNDLGAQLEVEARRFFEVGRTEDAQEAVRAFAEKRPPRFQGR